MNSRPIDIIPTFGARKKDAQYLSAFAPADINWNSLTIGLALGVMILFGAVFSFAFLLNQSLRLDEAQSLWQTSRVPGEVLRIVSQDVHVPFYHLFLHFWRVYVADGVWGGRILSLLFYLLSIPSLYLLGKRFYNKSTGLFAALLFTLSPFLIWYGSEIRMYSILTFMAIWNQYFFGGLLKDGKPWHWAGYAGSAILGIYTHYFFGFILLTQAIFYLFNRNKFPPAYFRKLLFTGSLVIISLLPWIYFVLSAGEVSNSNPILQEPTSVNLFNTYSEFLFGFQEDHVNTVIASLWPIAALLAFLAMRRSREVNDNTIYLILASILPVALAFGLSFVLKPIYLSRYLILSLPAFYLVLAWLLRIYSGWVSNFMKAGLVAAMGFMLLVQTVDAQTPVKENYREATEYLEERALPQDIIVVSAPFTIYPVEYYYRGVAALSTLPIWNRYINGPIPPFSQEKLPEEFEALKGNHEIAWVLLSYDQGYEERLKNYFDTNFEMIDNKEFSEGIRLYAYRLRYDIPFAGR